MSIRYPEEQEQVPLESRVMQVMREAYVELNDRLNAYPYETENELPAVQRLATALDDLAAANTDALDIRDVPRSQELTGLIENWAEGVVRHRLYMAVYQKRVDAYSEKMAELIQGRQVYAKSLRGGFPYREEGINIPLSRWDDPMEIEDTCIGADLANGWLLLGRPDCATIVPLLDYEDPMLPAAEIQIR